MSKSFIKKTFFLQLAKELTRRTKVLRINKKLSLWQSGAIASLQVSFKTLAPDPVQLIHGSEDQIISLAGTLNEVETFKI